MSQRPQSAQVGANKKSSAPNQNLGKSIGGGNNISSQGSTKTAANPKSGFSSLQRQLKQQTVGMNIKPKKNQTPFSFYKDICQKLNCNMNNAISHGLKGDEMMINADNLTISDIEPMRILLRECDFSTISLTGNKEFSQEEFNREHEQLIFKYRNTATTGINGNSSTLINGNTLPKNQNGFTSTYDERARLNGQTYDSAHQETHFDKTPLGNHNGQNGHTRAGDTSNKSHGLKEELKGFNKASSTAADGSNSNKNGTGKAKKQKKKFSSQTQSFVAIMNSVGVNIARVPTSSIQLTCVKIMNLNLKAESLAGICKGLQKSHTVKELYIQNCGLTSETIEKGMLEYMTEIKSLILLDLSYNKLDGQSGGLIGKLLSSHSKNRDEHIWLCGLRGEVPESDVNLEGICEVNLMGNLLTDKSIKDLCYFLQFDGWTRSVNLRFNRIGAEGLVELDKMLDNNENLISLDVRSNPGMTPNYDDFMKYGEGIKIVSKSIYDKLIRNIKIFKQKRDEMRLKQQQQIITNLQYDNNNQPLPPHIFPQFQDEAALMMMALQHQHQQQQQMHPDQNMDEQLMYAQQQQQLIQNAHLMQQQQQQNDIMPLQQNYFPQPIPEQQQNLSYKGHKSKQSSQVIQGQELQAQQQFNQNGNAILHQQGNQPQEQHFEHQGGDQGEEFQEEEEEEEYDEEKQEGEDQQGQDGEDLQAKEGEEEQQQEGELNEQQLILLEKQNFIFSEEFIEISQQNFQELYGENEEFLNLPEEQQVDIFQQFLTDQQEQYLAELENEFGYNKTYYPNKKEQMEGVQEVQEEQYEEDEDEQEEEEDQAHDNHYNEQQMYYQQNEGAEKPGQNKNSQQQLPNANLENEVHNQEEEANENEDQDATEQNQNGEEYQQDCEEIEEIEEDEQDEEQIKQVMEQIYEELQLEQLVDKDCKCCLQLQDKIIQSEYEKLNLMIKLNNSQLRLQNVEKHNASTSANLKQQIQQLQIAASQQNQFLQQQQIANSWSAIQPNTIDQDNNNMIMHPESFLLGGVTKQQQQQTLNPINQGTEQIDGEDMLNRIEGLMTELTRLMDNLETMQNNVTNNITCQLSNTTNTNNQTYQLLNSNPNINFNNTFTNILGGSHNNSNILPRNANSNFLNNLTQQIGMQQQASNFVPSQSSNNNTQIQQVSFNSGQKKSKNNPQRPIVQQQYYQQQQQPQQILHAQQMQQQQQQQQYGQLEQNQQEQFNRNAQKYNAHNNSR